MFKLEEKNMRVADPGRNGNPVIRDFPFLFSGRFFALLLLVLLVLKILRARMETSLWIDEVYSLLLSLRPGIERIHLTALDNHPPLYYLLLGGWIRMGGGLGLVTELLWARLLNVVIWLFFCLGAWLGGRSLLGKQGGAVLAWALASGAQVAQVTKDLRGYALATFSVFTCFLILFIGWKRSGRKKDFWEHLLDGLFWTLYALFGLIALYSHILTSFALLLLGIAWLYIVYKRRDGASVFFWGGLAAQGVVLALFVPWLVRISGQVAYVQSSNLLWMTPPNFLNLIRVYMFWFPYGQTPYPPIEAAFYMYVAGGLSCVLPWGAFFQAHKISPREKLLENPEKTLAVFGGLTSLFFPAVLLLVRLVTGIHVFHGPRYPSLVAPIWTLGLVAAALYATRRLKKSPVFLLLLLVPWFFCNIVGQVWTHSREKAGSLDRWKKVAAAFMPAKGEPLYILPSELIPYYKNTLGDYNVKSIGEIVQVPRQYQDILVLNMNPWRVLQTPRDTIILTLIRDGQLSKDLEKMEKSKDMEDFQSYRLKDFDLEEAKRLFQEGIKPAKRDIPDTAVSRAFPENQWLDEGWSVDEVDPKGNLFRWAMGEETKIRFDGTIMPGMYTLHFVGFRNPYPGETVDIKFNFERQLEVYTASQISGMFHMEMAVRITLKHKAPVLKVRHPVWRPMDYEEESDDMRPLTFLFFYAWLEPRPV